MEKRWWESEFEYLFQAKILTRDEMVCLFGQIKSVIERELGEKKGMPKEEK